MSSLPAEELAEMGLVAALTFNDVFKDGKTLYIQDLSSNALHARYFGVGDRLIKVGIYILKMCSGFMGRQNTFNNPTYGTWHYLV